MTSKLRKPMIISQIHRVKWFTNTSTNNSQMLAVDHREGSFSLKLSKIPRETLFHFGYQAASSTHA